ncbi:hypothetical protein P8625_02940 [Tenacibaculum tangerinum]|uniref:Uncharacterized protein n=1 Tax=Tenacibaculum tangerinum TaxID=3038772 RepID=A0ABY8L7E2_9FLAO|nr:hypothetical protein [Tenacibaculum tangerinum]WGH76140.1 hypothetical protein P8625_02940 [Tenacibaculum tangerinum]
MNNLAINALNGVSGLSISIAENTPIPVIIYAVVLLITEIYKYKKSKIKQCSDDCKKDKNNVN